MNPKQHDVGQASRELAHGELTRSIINCFLVVYNKLGVGMLERVYQNARVIELSRHGLGAQTEVPIEVVYRGVQAGFLRMDLLVQSKVAVEVKSSDLLPAIAKRQLLNYLRVRDIDIGLLLHFGPKPMFHRMESPRIRS